MRLAPEWLVLAGQGPGEALGSDRPGNPRHKVVDYHVEPEEAWHTVMLNRYPLRTVCAEWFDVMAK